MATYQEVTVQKCIPPKPETWLPVPGYPNYEVSDEGRVRSLDHEVRSRGGTRILRGRILKPRRRKDGYLQVCLYTDGKATANYMLVHAIVALAHIGPRPDGYDVCHSDDNGENNRLSNLRYDTHQGNCRDRKPVKAAA